MGEPDTKLAKILYGVFLASLAIIPLILIFIYASISSSCSSNNTPQKPEKPPTMTAALKFLIFFLLVFTLSGFTAQAINHSYPITAYYSKT